MDEDAARRRQAAGPLQQNFSLAAGLSLAKEGDLLEKWASDYGVRGTPSKIIRLR